MAAESPVLGQLRHIPTSSIVFPSSSGSSEPYPLFPPDPLQGLVHEMALSAVMQKHGSTGTSTAHTSNGAIIKNYMLPGQASSSMALITPSTEQQCVVTSAMMPQQPPGVVLGGANGSGFIALSSNQAAGNTLSLLAHPQASPVLQGHLSGQLHEVGTNAAAANMMQFTPVCCYEGTGSAQASPVVERPALVQPSLMG